MPATGRVKLWIFVVLVILAVIGLVSTICLAFLWKEKTQATTSAVQIVRSNPTSLLGDVYVIGGVKGGGSLKFITDLESTFGESVKRVTSLAELQAIPFNVTDTFLVQHIIPGLHDFTEKDVLDVQAKRKCRMMINIHDFYWVTKNVESCHHVYLRPEMPKVPNDIMKMFETADLVVHPSSFTMNQFGRAFKKSNFVKSKHIDIPSKIPTGVTVPPITDKTINIGVLHEPTIIKGSQFINALKKTFTKHKDCTVRFMVVSDTIPAYKESEFHRVVKSNRLHGLALLNRHGETYGYALSKYLNTGLPMIYNAFGAIKERVPENDPRYFKVFDKESEYENSLLSEFNNTHEKFREFLDYILRVSESKDKQKVKKSSYLVNDVPPLYKHIFSGPGCRDVWDRIHQKIQPYAIFFPQFHQIPENDVLFYPGMTDSVSLKRMIESPRKSYDVERIHTPDLAALGLNSIDEYDYLNKDLLARQVQLAHEWGMCGFGVYFYWFSKNTITNNNQMMERCIDALFSLKMPPGFKLFLNWANENWTKNEAFGRRTASRESIKNEYTEENIHKVVSCLMNYFKNDNYLKILNKPVFFIHHPFLMKKDELDLLRTVMERSCLENGFDGVHFVCLSVKKEKYPGVTTPYFDIFPKYKFGVESYASHVNYAEKQADDEAIATMFFSFDNSARMFEPAKPERTCSIVGNQLEQRKLLDSLVHRYKSEKRNDLQKLFMINSWNEWGENMAIEPSKEIGTKYLRMLKQAYLQLLPYVDEQ